MKSLAVTLLIFLNCLVVAGTVALIDRTQAMLSGGFRTPPNMAKADPTPTLLEFAQLAQRAFDLPQPSEPVAFEDVRPGDAGYRAAEAIYPFLHRQLICPECATISRLAPQEALTRVQAATALTGILNAQDRLTLLGPEQTAEVLADIPDAGELSAYARPYVATAIAKGILVLEPGSMIRPQALYRRSDLLTALAAIHRHYPTAVATASLPGGATGR